MKYILSLLLLLILTGLSPGCGSSPYDTYNIDKVAVSDLGMVVTAHPLATEAGIKILREGGNAADAAIAVQLALAVVYPRAGNIGGGGFLVYRNADGQVMTLDYREQAPKASHRDMFLDSAGQVIPHKSTEGILAAGVPGTIAGLAETHRKLGRLQPWSRLVEPAIQLAEKGFHITALEADRLNKNKEAFETYNAYPIPFLKTEPWKEGDLLIQKELAATMRTIAKEGQDGFYKGKHARDLVGFSQSQQGLMTLEDLASYSAKWREPFRIPWRDFTLYTMGLPSSGGILLHQILAMIEPHLQDSLGFQHPHNVHLTVEAERRAYADRAQYLGDADFYPVPLDSLLDSTYLVEKFSDYNPVKASVSHSIHPGTFTLVRESFETTHLSIIDGDGNAASVTTTLNNNYGCKVWVPGGGYFLNNEMDDFSIKPGVPNLYGLIGGEANAIAPGKRMLSSMTPTIVEKEGRLWMVVGTPGGSTIITSVLQVFLNAAVYNMSIENAVQAPRYHHQWLPDEILYERDGFAPDLLSQLQQYGHTVKPIDYIGLVEAILVDEKGVMHGAADRRGDDHAAGL